MLSLGLLGGLYFISRGFGNIIEAKEERAKAVALPPGLLLNRSTREAIRRFQFDRDYQRDKYRF